MIRCFRHAAIGYLILGTALTATRLLMFTAAGERKHPTLRARLVDLAGRAWLWLVSHGHGGHR